MALKANMRILLVDDLTTMRKIIKKMLLELGFTNITEAKNGKEALSLIEESCTSGKTFKLIVSDWDMPGVSGLDLLKELRNRSEYKKVPFLMVTAEAEQTKVVTALKAGVNNFIVKPFSPQVLEDKIVKIFGT